jgi:5'-3' exonuclease
VVQIDRRANVIRDDKGVKTKFGVSPELIPDLLALVGDSSDGYPGIKGIGKSGAARLLNQYGPIEKFPKNVLGDRLEQALLFKDLATLRTNARLFKKIDQLEWKGTTPAFEKFTEKIDEPRLLERAQKAALRVI